MGVFAQDIEAARKLLQEHGEDPEQYRFTMARNISDVYFSSRAKVISKIVVQKRNGIEQAYELNDNEAWIPRFAEDLRTSRFTREADAVE